jgi:hypothetical protein
MAQVEVPDDPNSESKKLPVVSTLAREREGARERKTQTNSP